MVSTGDGLRMLDHASLEHEAVPHSYFWTNIGFSAYLLIEEKYFVDTYLNACVQVH